MSGNWSKSAFFEGGWITLNADFRGKGASPTNHSWYQSNRVIALSCGLKISAVHHLVLSQCTRVADVQTDRITTPKTALAYARAVKTIENENEKIENENEKENAKTAKLVIQRKCWHTIQRLRVLRPYGVESVTNRGRYLGRSSIRLGQQV